MRIATLTRGDGEQGAAAFTVAVSLLLLMAFVALAIDAGLGYDDRRAGQNAADLAALAAAWQSCNPDMSGMTPQAVGIQTASDNGYPHDPAGFPQVMVNGSGGLWTATVTERNQAVFGRVTPNAPDEIDIVSAATARCVDVGVLGGYALFVGASGCPTKEMTLTGSGVDVTGGVHTNGEVLGGSGLSVTGTFTHRQGASGAGTSSAVQYFGSRIEYPIPVTIADYRPGPPFTVFPTGPRAGGPDYHPFSTDITAGSLAAAGLGVLSGPFGNPQITLTRSGIFYTTRDVELGGGLAFAPGVRATFVAEGEVTITSEAEFRGYDPIFTPTGPRLAILANSPGSPSCNSSADAVKVSAKSFDWTGVIFAPNGQVEVSTSTAVTFDGSIFSYTMDLSGADIDITFRDDPGAAPAFEVELVG